jgi:hypothetical protein
MSRVLSTPASSSAVSSSDAIWSSLFSDFLRCYQSGLPARLLDPYSSSDSSGSVFISARRALIGNSTDLHGIVNLINNQQDKATANLVRVSLAEVAKQIQQGKWWLIEQEKTGSGPLSDRGFAGKEIVGCIQFDLFHCGPEGTEGRKTLEAFEKQFQMDESEAEQKQSYRQPDFSGIFKGIIRERFIETAHGAHSDWEWKSTVNDPANCNLASWESKFADAKDYHESVFKHVNIAEHGREMFRKEVRIPEPAELGGESVVYPIGCYVGGLILAPIFRGHRVDLINGIPAYFVARIVITLLLGADLVALMDQPDLSAFLALSPSALLVHYHACRRMIQRFERQCFSLWIGTVQKSASGKDLDIFSQFLMGISQLAVNRSFIAIQQISNLMLNRLYYLEPTHSVFQNPNPTLFCLYDPLEPLNLDDGEAIESMKGRLKYRIAGLVSLPSIFASTMTIHNYFHPKPDEPSKRCNGIIIQLNCQNIEQIARVQDCSEFDAANSYLPMETDMRFPNAKQKASKDAEVEAGAASAATQAATEPAEPSSPTPGNRISHGRFTSRTLTEQAAERAKKARSLFIARIEAIRKSNDMFDVGEEVQRPEKTKLTVTMEGSQGSERIQSRIKGPSSPHLRATVEIFENGSTGSPKELEGVH